MQKWNVGGKIACHSLQEWWFSTFTEAERIYMDEKYQPMGFGPHNLTKGNVQSNQPTTIFLNSLQSWFQSSKDTSIAERIHKKVIELSNESPISKPGFYKGRHFTTYVADIQALKKKGELSEVESLLLALVDATEAEDRAEKDGVAPWYYNELAKLYRKQKDFVKEISILERYEKQRHAPGRMPEELFDRLEKVKLRMSSKSGK